ncbi:MAG: IS21-like element helper ATPase IstB, partial [Smithella sp.]
IVEMPPQYFGFVPFLPGSAHFHCIAGRLFFQSPFLLITGMLLSLMKREYVARQNNQLKRRIKRAKFPMLKTFDEFHMEYLNHVTPAFLKELANCDFVSKHQNVVMIGNPGTGKTHLMIALGLKACACGFNVLFKTAADLATDLCEARDEYRLQRLEKSIAQADLLLLDELSYISFNQQKSELLFKVISDRSERASTIISTNLDFSKWAELFDNPTMVAALVDRMTFHSYVLNMNGDSYRLNSRIKA